MSFVLYRKNGDLRTQPGGDTSKEKAEWVEVIVKSGVRVLWESSKEWNLLIGERQGSQKSPALRGKNIPAETRDAYLARAIMAAAEAEWEVLVFRDGQAEILDDTVVKTTRLPPTEEAMEAAALPPAEAEPVLEAEIVEDVQPKHTRGPVKRKRAPRKKKTEE